MTYSALWKKGLKSHPFRRNQFQIWNCCAQGGVLHFVFEHFVHHPGDGVRRCQRYAKAIHHAQVHGGGGGGVDKRLKGIQRLILHIIYYLIVNLPCAIIGLQDHRPDDDIIAKGRSPDLAGRKREVNPRLVGFQTGQL
jgi:hypothetical protein